MKNIINEIYINALKEGKKNFLVSDKKLSYKSCLKKINLLSDLFLKLDIKNGDRISLLSDNDEEIIIFFLASLFNGITFSIFDYDIKEERIKSILNEYKPVKIFIEKNKAEELNIKNDSFSILYTDKNTTYDIFYKFKKQNNLNELNYLKLINSCKETTPTFDIKSIHQTVLVLFTSGTTSQPKGVELSYNNIISHIKTLTKVYELSNESQMLNLMPLSHADGLIQGPLLSFFNNCTLHRPFKFKIQFIDLLTKNIKKNRITHLISPPMMLSLMHKYINKKEKIFDYENFHTVISVAAQLEAKLYKDFTNDFKTKIINVYGLTETVAGSIFTNPNDFEQAGTIGISIDCEAKIIAEDGSEIIDDSIGELLIKGDHIMKGYFNNQLETDKIIKNDWLYTGDLAIKRNDRYSIVGRKKNVVICGGFTIYPEEITEILNKHEGILESLSYGVENDLWGEEIISAVVLKNNYSLTENDIKCYCQKHLEAYKIPRNIILLDFLPKGKSGKIQIEELKKNINLHNQKDLSTLNRIIQTASECFLISIDKINLDSSSDNIETWDSLGHLDFISALENEFSIKFKMVEILKINSIQDCLDIIESKI